MQGFGHAGLLSNFQEEKLAVVLIEVMGFFKLRPYLHTEKMRVFSAFPLHKKGIDNISYINLCFTCEFSLKRSA
jgi:hypothetical protein